MASIITLRDLDLFRALARGPLTVRQLLKLSATFHVPFGSERRLQDRLHILAEAGLLCRGLYATTEPSLLSYFTLSRESYRLLYGKDAVVPRALGQVGISRQNHTRALADFLVHTFVSAQQAGVQVADFSPENALRLEAEGDSLYPDSAFSLDVPGRTSFRFFIELDTGSEPITSPRESVSWERKLSFYESLRNAGDDRFRVLGLITAGQARVNHILHAAADASHNRHRPLFFGARLQDYLDSANPLFDRCFRDHHDKAVALIPPQRSSQVERVASAALAPAISL